MTMTETRIAIGRTVYWTGLVVGLLFVLELVFTAVVSSLPRGWLFVHAHWIWRHSDDRSLLLPMIRLWEASFLLFLFSLLSVAEQRKRAWIVTACVAVGGPVLFFVAVLAIRI